MLSIYADSVLLHKKYSGANTWAQRGKRGKRFYADMTAV